MRRIIAVSLIMACGTVGAHEPMNDTCVAPERPVDDQDDAAWHQFLRDVDAFRACVNDKMTWHEQAADRHHEKARQLVAAWNEFVRTSLNAPEDFPWPPED